MKYATSAPSIQLSALLFFSQGYVCVICAESRLGSRSMVKANCRLLLKVDPVGHWCSVAIDASQHLWGVCAVCAGSCQSKCVKRKQSFNPFLKLHLCKTVYLFVFVSVLGCISCFCICVCNYVFISIGSHQLVNQFSSWRPKAALAWRSNCGVSNLFSPLSTSKCLHLLQVLLNMSLCLTGTDNIEVDGLFAIQKHGECC